MKNIVDLLKFQLEDQLADIIFKGMFNQVSQSFQTSWIYISMQ